MALVVFPVDESSAKSGFQSYFGAKHQGIDIFAAAGTPVLAVDAGQMRSADDPLGGQVLYLKSADGQSYYYAHLSSYSGSFPRAVSAGEVVGFVGTSGNAAGKAPHLHFEIHPTGTRDAIDPYPQLVAARTSSMPSEPATDVISNVPSYAKSSVPIGAVALLVGAGVVGVVGVVVVLTGAQKQWKVRRV